MYSHCGGLVGEMAGNQIVIVNCKYQEEKKCRYCSEQVMSEPILTA